MINKELRRVIFILLLIIPFHNGYSQQSDLSLIGSLASNFSNSGNSGNSGNSDIQKENSDNSEIEEPEANNNDVNISFEDSSFSYTGGDDFITAPQEDLSTLTLKYFGYEYFIKAPSTYASTKSIPIPPDYIIGPNDNIQVILFGSQNNTYQLKVSREGEIFFPNIGPISVAGLSFQEMKELILNIIKNQLIGTQVNITLGTLRSIDVFVLGEANRPGMYTVSALSSLTNAIFKSGGPSINGSLRNIQLKRSGKTISMFDFYQLLLAGNTANDARLMQGDVIFIPPVSKTVGISGEVSRPAIYELTSDETLGDLIKYAGNLKPKASINTAKLARVDKRLNSFNLIPLSSFKDKNSFELIHGDFITIHSIINNLNNAILISGHAQQPGFQPWEKGMRILDIIKSSDDLLPMTDINYLIIKREDPINQKSNFLQVDLEDLFNDSTSDKNILINDQDELIFLPSLLTIEQITTKMIQDKYIYDKDTRKYVLENEWDSLTYLRKSLLEEMLTLEEKESLTFDNETSTSNNSISETDIRRYYEYSIYDYCSIPESLVIQAIEATGFRSKKTIELDQLEGITTPKELLAFQRLIENDRLKAQSVSSSLKITDEITNTCRKELLNPLLMVIGRQNETSIEQKIVQVFGNVHFPGSYPLTDDMRLEDAIKAAGGLNVGTYAPEIELVRSDNLDKRFVVSSSSASLSNSESMNTLLKEMDIINVKEVSNEIKTVEITGEVYFSGQYPIGENETISQLIERAGGLTEYGSIESVVFLRDSIKETQIERINSARDELQRKIVLSSQTGGLGQTSLDSDAIEALTRLIVGDSVNENGLGRLVIDLESILVGKINDVYLEDGDSINIPRAKQSIAVIGEVFVENAHLFKGNLTIDDYIQMSGGMNDYADGSNIYLIKSDGSIVSSSKLSDSGFFRSSNNSIGPGDTIVVPLQLQPFSAIRATTEVTQIIYQMAIAAAAVNSF
jgi:polysaccharide biosynthesis/export protein